MDSINPDMKSALKKCLENSEAEVCYVLVNYTALYPTQTTMLEVQKEVGLTVRNEGGANYGK